MGFKWTTKEEVNFNNGVEVAKKAIKDAKKNGNPDLIADAEDNLAWITPRRDAIAAANRAHEAVMDDLYRKAREADER